MSQKKPRKHFEIVEHELHGVKVLVEIDYDKGTISLLDQPQRNATKKWVFAGREVDYMQGWRHILDAMKNAINLAEVALREHELMVEKEKFALQRAVQKAAGEK